MTAPSFTVALGATVVAGDTVELLLGGAPLAHPVTHTVTAAEVTAGSVNLAVTAGDLGADGVKQISARLSDGLGNSSTTGALSVTLDSSAPVVAIGNPGGATNQPSLILTGTVSGADAGTTIAIFDGVTQIGVANISGGTWSANVTLNNGANLLTAQVVDAAGNTATSGAVTYTLNTTAPTGGTPDLVAASDSGSSNSDNITSVTAPSFTVALGATVVAGDTVELLLGGSPLAHPVTHTVTAAEVTAGSVNLAVTAGDLGADGVKQISARLSDGLGNSSTTGALSVTLDTTAPAETLAITAIASDTGSSSSDFITNDTTLTVSGTNGALAAGEKIQVSSDGGTTWTDVVQNGTSWSLVDVTSHPSSFTYQARIVDTAGNIGTAASQAVTIDTAAPVVAIGNPGGATNQPSLILTGTVSGADAGTTIAIFDGVTQIGVANISGGTWSANVTLNNGANLLTAQVVDAAGNTATSGAVTYTLNTTAPTGGTPDLVAASDSGSSNSDNITSVTAPSFTVALGATVVAGDTVELLLGGSPLAHPVTHTVTAAEVTAGSVNLAVTAGDLGADGVKQISARLSDGLGNSSTTGALSVTLDTTAPAETLAITAIASDTGSSSSDFITSDTTLTVSGTNGALAAGEKIQVSSDGGTTWTDVVQNGTSWSLVDTTAIRRALPIRRGSSTPPAISALPRARPSPSTPRHRPRPWRSRRLPVTPAAHPPTSSPATPR